MREEGEKRGQSQDAQRARMHAAPLRIGPAACRGLLENAEGLTSRFIALRRDLNALELENVSVCVASLLRGPDGVCRLQSNSGMDVADGLAEEVLLSDLIERAIDLGATCKAAIPIPEPVPGIDDFRIEHPHATDQHWDDKGAG